MKDEQPIRSFLFVPALRLDFLDKQVYWLEQHGFMVVTRTGIPTTGASK